MSAIRPETWQEAAWEAAGEVYVHYHPLVGLPNDRLERLIIGRVHALVADAFGQTHDKLTVAAARDDLRRTGAEALRGYTVLTYGSGVDTFAKGSLRDLCDLLAKKQHDYGHGNISRFGLDGILVRLNDKVERLHNLSKRDADGLNESLTDTWADIVGYCILGLMLVRDTFMLPLAEDV